MRTRASSPTMASSPHIDGVINANEWKEAVKFSGGGYKGVIDPRFLNVWMGHDKKYIYVAIRSKLPLFGKLLTTAVEPMEVFNDDNIEIIITPPKDRPAGPLKFGSFQVVLNSAGLMFKRHDNPGWGLSYQAWNPEIIKKGRLNNDNWDFEMAIPVKSLGFNEIHNGSKWGFVVSRNFKNPSAYAAITPGVVFKDEKSQGVLTCEKNSTVVQVSYPAWNKNRGENIEISLYNPSDKKTDISTEIKYIPNGNSIDKIIELNAGQKKIISFQKTAGPEFNYRTIVTVKQGDKIIFSRESLFPPHTEKKWNNPESSKIFDLSFNKVDFIPEIAINPKPIIVGNPIIEKSKNNRFHYAVIPVNSAITYLNSNISVPGGIYCEIKTGKPLKKGERRGIWSTKYTPNGYIVLFETDRFIMLNFLAYPWQKNTPNKKSSIIWYKTSKELSGWFNIMVNLGVNKTTMYINGQNVGECTYPELLNASKLGGLSIGWQSKSVNDFKIRRLKTFNKFFSAQDIDALGLQVSFLNGQISYFPSMSELVIDAKVTSEQLAKSPILSLQLFKGTTVIKTYPINVDKDFEWTEKKEHIIHKRFKLPELQEGKYHCYINVEFPSFSFPIHSLEKTFDVKHFVWANNKMGLKDILIPPFTPLKVDGNEVSCLLRKYLIATNGLPQKIFSLGDQLLSEPVSLVIRSQGKESTMTGKRFKFINKSDTSVSYLAETTNKELDVSIHGDFDYDGLLKLTLKLHPKDSPIIDQVFVNIKLKDKFAKLFHAAGTGNRKNPAGLLPLGTGRIWRSRSINHSFDNFVPYTWIGEEKKGICYIADWDKDWIHCEDRDAVEIIRDDNGNVSIRLNLINGPVKLERDRTIVFCIMASPIKPMPEGWRGRSDYWVANHLPGKTFSHCFYAPQTWGSFYGSAGQYPLARDFQIIRELRETIETGIINKPFIENFVKKAQISWDKEDGDMDFKKLSSAYKTRKDLKTTEEVGVYVKRMLDWGFNQAKELYKLKGQELIWYIYFTCLYEQREILPEYKYYKDEWKRHMVKSFQDYSIYYADKLLDNGVDGFYLDNTALAGMKLWPTGDGFIDDKGKLHPSAGVWRIRSYIKRLATLFAEKGKLQFISIHNTNANILPLYSFANATLGDEWKYGDSDYQTRFTPGYLRTVSFGRQGGFIPLAIAGIQGTDDKKLKWATRTMLACLLPHEIEPTIILNGKYSRGELLRIWSIIYDFGKAESNCEFLPYWNVNTPVKSEKKDLLVSAYFRENKLLLVCGNYGGASVVSIKLNMSTLGSSKIVSAVNAETDEKLEITENSLLLPIEKHDLAIIEVTLLRP